MEFLKTLPVSTWPLGMNEGDKRKMELIRVYAKVGLIGKRGWGWGCREEVGSEKLQGI